MSHTSPGYISSDSFQLSHLSPHGVDCSGRRIEEIPGGSSCFLFFSDDFYFAHLPEDDQLMVLPVMLKSLRMSEVGKCHFGVRLPEDSEVLQMLRRFAGFSEGDSIESSLIYTSRYFSRYERAGILVENQFRKAKSIFVLSQEHVFALVSRSLYVGGEFNYPPREEVFMSLQALCGEPSVDKRIRKYGLFGTQRGYPEVPVFCQPALP